jgi:hypothetical protein
MRIARGSGTLASSSGMISAAVIFGFAPSSILTPARTSTGTSSFTLSPRRLYASGKTIMSIEPDMSSSVACA